MTKRQMQILLRTVLANSLLLTVIVLFFIAARLFSAISYCPLKLFLHLYCPGCGGTRALSALLSGNVIDSLKLNPILTALVLYVLFYEISAICSIIPNKTVFIDTVYFQKLQSVVAIAFAVFVILFFIIRNLLLVYFSYDPIGDLAAYRNIIR